MMHLVSPGGYRPRIRFVSIWIVLFFSIGVCLLNAQESYTVKPHDTVYGIARTHKISVDELYRLNPELKSRSLRSGEVIRVSVGRSIPPRAPSVSGNKTVIHPVQKGETLSSISRSYGISVKDLVRLNPEISPDHLPEGFRLVIPSSAGSHPKPNVAAPSTVERALSRETTPTKPSRSFGDVFGGLGKVDTVRVSLILPLAAQAPERYIRFYEGFLMGLNDLKKSGISVILHTYNADSSEEVRKIMNSGSLIGEHLIIGGVSEGGIDNLSAYSHKRGLPYVIPFNSQTDASLLGNNVYQINAPQEYIYNYIAAEFARVYADRKIVFVGDRSQAEPIIAPIVESLKRSGVHYRYTSIDDLSQTDASTVVVPLKAEKQLLLSVMDRLEAAKSTAELFGYPVWQTYDKRTIERMSQSGCTIYSTFFFNESDPETNVFASKYNAWYGHRIAGGYPKYSVLGYDVARYFVRAVASYGMGFSNHLAQIPTDGLQTDFALMQSTGRGGYINANVFFVRYRSSGLPQRRSIFR